MVAAYKPIHSTAIFGILMAMFAAILIFLFTVAPEVREETLPPYVVSYESTLFDVSPGTLESGTIESGVKHISLNDVVIDNTVQRTELDISRDASFSTSLFSNEVYDFAFTLDKELVKKSGLTFTVYSLSGDGEMRVYINGRTALSKAVGVGSQVVVEFPESYIVDGANRVEITTASPGLNFWSKNAVTLLDVTLFVDEYDTGKSESSQVFSLSSSEAANAESAIIKAYIEQKGESANVDIRLNGNRLLRATPPQTLELSVPTTAFKSGANVITWYTERDGKYAIKFSNVLIDTVKTTGRATTYFFTIKDEDFRKVDSGSYICSLTLTRDSGDESVIVELNAKQDVYDFLGEKFSVDVCDQLRSGRNEIKFTAEDELDLKSATLIIKNN
jgi:hypothetical protein